MLRGHGAEIYDYDHLVADFSSNVSWVDYSEVLAPIIAGNIAKLHAYPDVHYSELCADLAAEYGLSADHFLISNGAVAGIYQCAQAYAGERSALFYPEFAEYEGALQMYGHEVSYLPVGELSGVPDDCKFVMLGNPNNPTGKLLKRDLLCAAMREHSERVFVVDESYMEFVSEPESLISEVRNFPNLIVIKSFTKRYSIPGLRLGYIVAAPELCARLNQWSQPWSVNSLAAAVGGYILREPEKFAFDDVGYVREKQRFYEALSVMLELDVAWSEANYFLIDLKKTSARELKAYLIDKYGLLVRDASNFRGLGASAVRVAVRSREDNDLLIDGLKAFFLSGDYQICDGGGEV